ncbi:MAG: biopolymer transporter ExbD [Candidatus Krumholzibacteriia bacterium]
MRKQPYGVETRVTVVPIINVSLVVVLTLMMIAPFLSGQEVDVDLPEARAAEVDDTDNIEITYTLGHEIFIGEDQVTLSEVPAYLGVLFAELPHAVAVVKADQGVRYGDVERLIAAVEGSQARRIALATRPKDGEAQR